MAYHPYKPAPQERRSSNPTWSSRAQPTALFTPSKSALNTPHNGTSNPRTTGLPKARGSPYKTPNSTKVTLKNGQIRPMELFQPKDLQGLLAKQTHRRNEANPTSPPGHARLLERKPKYIPFPSKSEVDKNDTSPKPVSPPMQGTTRQVERPRGSKLPTLQLSKVMKKCWDDDSMKDFDYAMADGLLNGRNEARDRSRMWGGLGHAVYTFWPELGDWIMRHAPSPPEYDYDYLDLRERGSWHDIGYTYDPILAAKDSSLDRVGFYMSESMYNAACKIVRSLAKRDSDLQSLLHRSINPFFVIYACADCDVPLPMEFNRKLLWNHLDAILRAKCWRGLGSGRPDTRHYTSRASASASVNGDHIPPKFLRRGEDPEGILQSLLRISYRGDPHDLPPAPTVFDEPRVPVHRLSITIEDYKWVVKAGAAGTVWYQAGDLLDEDDIACFAVLDVLTRLLHSFRRGIVEITTGDIHILWGISGGPPPASGSGAWSVVQAICRQYQVKLRGSWTGLRGPDPREKILPEDIAVPPRDYDVIVAVLDAFKQSGLEDKAACRCMIDHLVQVTTDPTNESEVRDSV